MIKAFIIHNEILQCTKHDIVEREMRRGDGRKYIIFNRGETLKRTNTQKYAYVYITIIDTSYFIT